MAKLSSCGKDWKGLQSQSIYYLVLHTKSLLLPEVKENTNVEGNGSYKKKTQMKRLQMGHKAFEKYTGWN